MKSLTTDRPSRIATIEGLNGAASGQIVPLPSLTVQKLTMEGRDPVDERRFDGDLITVLRELDSFVKTMFSSEPQAVSALREENRSPYPAPAVRELLMNALMHRDYESNAPVRFYQFSDHIEIQNPGGLYGAVTPQTFPNQNDYRNPKIAEAMKTLGYVNTFGRGIARAQRFLGENGNPLAEFDVSQPNFFLVTMREVPA